MPLRSRFDGDDGRRRLVDALLGQKVVLGNLAIAEAIANSCELVEIGRDDQLIRQADTDTDVYLILIGQVAIVVNGRAVAIREAGTHVGEMAAIDTKAVRSADVRALLPTLVAKLTEQQLSAIATSFPEVWRRFAMELSDRLRERSQFIREPNIAPHMFIGSSAEQLNVAQTIQAGLSHDDWSVQIWTDDAFRASDTTLESLIRATQRADFALLVMGADDTLIRRGETQRVPRDNVVFELGLFIGTVGRDRTYIVKRRDEAIALPTDVLGTNPLEYAHGEESTLSARLGPVCLDLRNLIRNLGPK